MLHKILNHFWPTQFYNRLIEIRVAHAKLVDALYKYKADPNPDGTIGNYKQCTEIMDILALEQYKEYLITKEIRWWQIIFEKPHWR